MGSEARQGSEASDRDSLYVVNEWEGRKGGGKQHE